MTRKREDNTVPRTVRCAVYCRVSTDEKLNREFNSLDAQRESGEAYIASHKGEGWVCLPDRYDDGGHTGGNVERPALKRLLEDVEAGRIDTIVIYKIDRLSRSLMDFSRLMETFERRGVSLVSVTQAFSTGTSMGKLTLHILMSFAQFEREVISERIRDKIGMARRRGKWTGGVPVLGYDVERSEAGPRLVVNAAEAQQVRAIFALYLELGSLQPVAVELSKRGWTTKKRVTGKGKAVGGTPFDKAILHSHLTNPIYFGIVTHKGERYQGEHHAIIDKDTFERVQSMLKANARGGGASTRNQHAALLRGLLRCKACDSAMTHTFTTTRRRGAYRYYRCCSAIKKGTHACPSGSLPALEIERVVIDEVRGLASDGALFKRVLAEAQREQRERVEALVGERDELRADLKRAHADLRRVAGKPGSAARAAEINARVAQAEPRLAEVERAVAEAESKELDPDAARRAFAGFDEVWRHLTPREQERLLRLLVASVVYDSQNESVSVTLRPSGIRTLIAKEHAA